MVKIREPAMDTLEKPSPIPVAFQASGGPPEGHSAKSPVSGDMPSRCGPRHCGQSAAFNTQIELSRIRRSEYNIADLDVRNGGSINKAVFGLRRRRCEEGRA